MGKAAEASAKNQDEVDLQREQDQEEEQELEEEAVEGATKKKYARDGENPTPWPVALLHQFNEAKPEIKNDVFYGCKEFSVKNHTFQRSISLKFPKYLHLSRNYYDRSWSTKSHRRLKNVIVVMDFAPTQKTLVNLVA